MSLLHRLRYAVLAVFVLLWIAAFALTHVRGNDLPSGLPSDRVLHATGFLGLCAWFILTLASFDARPLPRILATLGIMLAYGAIDEYTQQFFSRTTDFDDWLSDAAGTLIAIVLVESLLWLAARRKPRTPCS